MPEGKSALLRVRRTLRPLAWDEINEPGAYVEVSTGKLYRITQESLLVDNSPAKPGEGGPGSPVVQLSKDPYIVELAARMLCVEHNIPPNF
jgi:hypothetical protein